MKRGRQPRELHVRADELPAVSLREGGAEKDEAAVLRSRADDALDSSLARLEEQVRLRVDGVAG